MSKPSIPVIKFLFREDHRVLGEALSLGSGFEIEEFPNSHDLSTYLSTIPAGLVVTSLHDKNDLVQIATFMKLGRKVAKDCAIKVVVFNFSKDRTFEKAIAKLGILDLVEPGINTKALKFKIDFWMKSLNGQIKKNESASPQKVKSLEQAKTSDKTGVDSYSVNWMNELELEDDIWLLKNDNDCKKILSKWLVKLVGPGPYAGQWSEVKSNLWRFDIKESEKELFVPGEGDWFFSGDQKPDFVWKENIWLISGDNFDLYFKNSDGIFSRLNCKNKIIQVCKNSVFAKTKEQVIIESFDKEIVFKREAAHLEDLEGKNNTDHLNSGNLQGKADTDEISGGPLEGKNKTPAERSGNLTGKMKGEEAIEHKNLEQKTSTAKEKSHWENKNSYEEEEKNADLGVKSEKHRSGTNLERENSENDHQKYYKNHNEAQQYGSGELGKGLHGKSSTEELDAHNDLAGKSDTDKLKSHYGRKDNVESPIAKEKDLNGPTSTDKLASHYDRSEKEKEENAHSEKENGQVEKENKGLEGKSSTEKLDSHYGKKSPGSPEKDQQKSDSNPEAKDRPGLTKNHKAESEEPKQQSQKSNLYNNWDGNHDFGFKSEESKLYARRADDDSQNEGADILPLLKAREEKAKNKNPAEQSLEKLTEDAKIISLMIQQGREIECGFDDFFDGNIIFSTNDEKIHSSSDVNLDLKFNYMGKENVLKIKGNVESVESDGEDKNYVTVKLSEENAIAFDKFMKLFETRQQNVNEFLKKARGL